MENTKCLVQIKEEIKTLIDEAISLIKKDSRAYKFSSVYWYYTIRMAVGYSTTDHFYTLDDAIQEIQELEE